MEEGQSIISLNHVPSLSGNKGRGSPFVYEKNKSYKNLNDFPMQQIHQGQNLNLEFIF